MAAVIQQLRWGRGICNYWLQMLTLSRILLTPFNCWKSLVPAEQELNINACNSHFCQLLSWCFLDETKLAGNKWASHSSLELTALARSWFSSGGVEAPTPKVTSAPEPASPWPVGLKEPVPAHCRGLGAEPCVRRAAQPAGEASAGTARAVRALPGVEASIPAARPRVLKPTVTSASLRRPLWRLPGPPWLVRL